MAQDMDRLLKRLDDLLAVDIDAVNAYQEAIDRISVSSVQDQLRQFKEDHQRHIRELSECVTRFGEKPREKGDFKGFFLKGFTAVSSMMGDEAALKAMRQNEQITNRSYEKALEEEGLPDDVRAIFERGLADEKRHLAVIEEMIRTRAWETGEQPRA
jgi:uncharacterized protein (TIGR02284 family)